MYKKILSLISRRYSSRRLLFSPRLMFLRPNRTLSTLLPSQRFILKPSITKPLKSNNNSNSKQQSSHNSKNYSNNYYKTSKNKNAWIFGASACASTAALLTTQTVSASNKSHSSHSSHSSPTSTPNTVIIGSGEYVTGFTPYGEAKSDKNMGVVGLVFFDLRKRGLVGSDIAIVGTSGNKFHNIRKHWSNTLAKVFYGSFPLPNDLDFVQYPEPGKKDSHAYYEAISNARRGDVCIIFTPDDTHYDIVSCAIDHGLHVLCTKPFVMTLSEHIDLVEKARKKGVLLQIEVHKRFDPMYNDAVNKMSDESYGKFNYYVSYMSQPKHQLETFRSWAGISSDISYYLNSHHIDLHVWAMQNKAKCISVSAMASNGIVARDLLNRECEDTISIFAKWKNYNKDNNNKPQGSNYEYTWDGRKRDNNNDSIGHAIYTSSWTAVQADVHSQQRFFCLMENGEINIDQAHRGYTLARDKNIGGKGIENINPLFHRNTPDKQGKYVSQSCYGYVTFESFVKAAKEINDGKKVPEDFDEILPTGNVTKVVTAILEGGRISLDNNGCNVNFIYDNNGDLIGLKPEL